MTLLYKERKQFFFKGPLLSHPGAETLQCPSFAVSILYQYMLETEPGTF